MKSAVVRHEVMVQRVDGSRHTAYLHEAPRVPEAGRKHSCMTPDPSLSLTGAVTLAGPRLRPHILRWENRCRPADPPRDCHLHRSCLRPLTLGRPPTAFYTARARLRSQHNLWPTASRPVWLGVGLPSEAHDQILITVGQSLVC
jgi:hypothetical protein